MYLISSKSRSIWAIAFFFNLLWIHKSPAQSKLDSLETILPKQRGKERIVTCHNIFKEYYDRDQLRKAAQYAEIALTESRALKDTFWIVKSLNARGYSFGAVGKLNASIVDFNEAVGYTQAKIDSGQDPDGAFRQQQKFILNNLGTNYNRLSNFAKALETFYRSLKIREEDKDSVGISVVLNNIGMCYKDLGDAENAKSSLQQSYDLAVPRPEKFEPGDLNLRLINLAEVSTSIGLFEEAKQYIKLVFTNCQNNSCKDYILGLAHHQYGKTLLGAGELANAEKEFRVALGIWQDLRDPDEIGELTSLAEVKFELGQYNQALDYLDESEGLADETDFLRNHLANFKLYARIYEKLKDFRLAHDYQQRYSDLYEKIFNKDLMRNLAVVQSRYLEAENLKTIERQGEELELNKKLITAQRNQVIFFTVVCLLIAGLVFVLWRFSLVQRKSNMDLLAAKATIEDQNTELTEINRTLDQRILDKTQELLMANISLQKSNEEMDHFVYKTSHDIRGPLASLKGIASLALIESRDEEVTRYIRMLDETADGLIRILTRMVSISQITHTQLQPAQVDVQQLVAEALNIQNKRGFPRGLRLEQDIQKGLTLISDKNLMGIIIGNLLDNAVKFRNTSERADAFINIHASSSAEGTIILKVTDNGIGIDKATIDKIFQMFVRASERSATGGLGLYLSRLATEKLGGTISVVVTPEGWTQFCAVLPADLQEILEQRGRQEVQREMENLKFRLLAMTSHEMRTPLTSIQTSAEALAIRLRETPAAGREDIRRNIDRILSEINRVTRIIDDVIAGREGPQP